MSRVTIDGPTGTLRIGGGKVFPLGLSNAPPLGGKTPAGKDGLKELADWICPGVEEEGVAQAIEAYLDSRA